MTMAEVKTFPSTQPYETLSHIEKKGYSKLGDTMQFFHSHMKQGFEELYELSDGKYTKVGMSLPMFLYTALTWRRQILAHHSIEETWLFPELAKKMDAFKHDEQHRNSHKDIHAGLDRLGTLLSRFQAEPSSYSPDELRACLDSFREVLLRHLDEEVYELRGENMYQYWTIKDIESFTRH